MSKVFLLEKPRAYDVAGLDKFGEVVCLFRPECARPSIWSDHFQLTVLRELEERGFDPYFDYFAVAGSTVPVALATAAISSHYEGVRLLLWNAVQQRYVSQEIVDAA